MTIFRIRKGESLTTNQQLTFNWIVAFRWFHFKLFENLRTSILTCMPERWKTSVSLWVLDFLDCWIASESIQSELFFRLWQTRDRCHRETRWPRCTCRRHCGRRDWRRRRFHGRFLRKIGCDEASPNILQLIDYLNLKMKDSENRLYLNQSSRFNDWKC